MDWAPWLVTLGLVLGACEAPRSTTERAPVPVPQQATPAVDPAFPRLGPPPPGGWRTRVEEPGQSLEAYQEFIPNRPTPQRRTLYLQPLGEYPREPVLVGDLPSVQLEEDGFVTFVFSPPPEQLADFLARFYGLPARVRPTLPLTELAPEPARIHNHHAQFDARALLEAVGPELPEDAYSMTALVARDLFVSVEQDHAYGYGLHRDRLALASFVQLDPQFIGRVRGPDFQARIRERSYKLLAHEVGHTLGMEHCDQYECVMNGVAHLTELDATPLHLCPSCLAKLLWLVELDPVDRYRGLAEHYEAHGLTQAKAWAEARLETSAG